MADALSRIEINNIENAIDETNIDDRSDAATIHSAGEDSQNHIQISELPLNIFKKQLIVKTAKCNKVSIEKLPLGKERKIFRTTSIDQKYCEYIINNDLPKKGLAAIMIKNIKDYVMF